MLVAIIGTLVTRGWLTTTAARRAYRTVVVRATAVAAAMAAIHVAGSAYLAITDPQVGTWPLQVLNTFLPVTLAAVTTLWLATVVSAAVPRLAERSWGAWLRAIVPARRIPLWTAGLIAASSVAYVVHLGNWLALQVLFG